MGRLQIYKTGDDRGLYVTTYNKLTGENWKIKRIDGFEYPYIDDKICIKCGKCAEECPVWAIPSDNLTSVDKDRCMACMHCIAVCPKQARRVPEEILAGLVKHLEPLCQGRKQNQLFV